VTNNDILVGTPDREHIKHPADQYRDDEAALYLGDGYEPITTSSIAIIVHGPVEPAPTTAQLEAIVADSNFVKKMRKSYKNQPVSAGAHVSNNMDWDVYKDVAIRQPGFGRGIVSRKWSAAVRWTLPIAVSIAIAATGPILTLLASQIK
jgi:hypothetical protein